MAREHSSINLRKAMAGLGLFDLLMALFLKFELQ